MFKNYFRMAIRNFRKNPFLAAINIGGLAIGIRAGFGVYPMVAYEFGFDRFHPG